MDIYSKIEKHFEFLNFFNQHADLGITFLMVEKQVPGQNRILFIIRADDHIITEKNQNPDPEREMLERFCVARWENDGIDRAGRPQLSGNKRFQLKISFYESELKEIEDFPDFLKRDYKEKFESYKDILNFHKSASAPEMAVYIEKSAHLSNRGSQGRDLKISDLFINEDYQKYVVALQTCSPPLLDNNYKFISNNKKHRGVIAQWFHYLKTKGIVGSSWNREQIAAVLSSNLDNYFVSGSTVDAESNSFAQNFKSQLIQLSK